MSDSKVISGPKFKFEEELAAAVADGWKITHFDTAWFDHRYSDNQYMHFAAVLIKEDSDE